MQAGILAMTRSRTAITLALAWTPLFVLWSLVTLSFGVRLTLALGMGLAVTISSAAMALPVWWLSGRYPWPRRLRPGFYAVHLLVGACYAAGWVLFLYTYVAVRDGGSVLALIREGSEIVVWQLVTGIWLYGLVAGVSYALRNRRRAEQQEHVAARARALAAQAQLQALRARLEPHFLFNALHTLSALIRQDPKAAERAVEKLGGLLRYVLDEGDDDVLLADEWRFTRDYLDIERLRLGEHLRLDLDVQPDTLSCPVPAFTLQTLVENAVRHGIAPRVGGGVLAIHSTLDGDRLLLHVRDDGAGADPEAVLDSDGMGLRALRERLHALYGERARIHIDTAPGRSFSALVDLPARGPTEGEP